MSLGPFLRRELATSVRSERAFADRRVASLLASTTVVGCFLLWDRQGWDRSSVLGAHWFGLAMFGMMVTGMSLLAFGVVLQLVAGSIASERDRKTLDALLASRFASAEIILGAVVCGLLRYANGLLAFVPAVVLIVYLGGVSPLWTVLAGVGLASTACILAGFAVAASVGARTRNRAVMVATGWFTAWFALPVLFLTFRPFLWAGAPAWLTSTIIVVSDSSPMGLLSNLLGITPRPGGPIVAVGRMAAWQLVWTLALVVWSIVRLRPASRGLYDVEGEQGRIKRLKAALRRPPRRPSCSDHPVFWSEAYTSRAEGLVRRLWNRAINLAWVMALVVGTWYFARPAFVELAARGYGPSSDIFAMPDWHPLLRLMIKIRVPTFPFAPNAVQARLEFNMVLRLCTAFSILMLAATSFSSGFESIKRERRRDTWLALIATPLDAREILRGKALGVLWKLRWGLLAMVAPWTVGLASGAVHPLGYLAALVMLAALAVFFPSIGLLFALQEWDHETQGKASVSLLQVPGMVVGSVLLIAGPVALGWASLLTYEDIAAAIRSGPLPEFREAVIGQWIDARGVLVGLFLGIGALAIGAVWLDRRNERGFDKAVGRPVRAAVQSGSATDRMTELL